MSQTERIIHILDLLRKNKIFTTTDIAASYEVSDRTVRRDIEYVRDRLRIDIRHCEGGYSLSEQDRRYLADLQMGEGLVYLSLLKSILQNHFLFPVDYDEVGKALRIPADSSVDTLTDRISYTMSEEKLFDFSFFSSLIQAMDRRFCLEIVYSDINGRESERVIAPQYLRNCDGQWYLLAYCHSRKDLRIFHLSRIVRWDELHHVLFDPLPLEDAVNAFDSSFGVMTGSGNVVSVSILFSGKAENIVSGKVWHKDQLVEKREGGTVVSFPVHSFEEVLRIVLSYHSEAEVLGPEEFREMWLGKIREMGEKFL